MKYIAISQPGGPEVLQIREGEIPTIGEHEVLIEVKAAGVNRPDILPVSYTHLTLPTIA